ncbi:MAG: S46 family peptidase [Planctomycetes bacterium]|nr:S46 family peptidase [Planctomycetota bacterium]
MRIRTPIAVAALFALATPAATQDHKELGRMWTFEHAPLDWFEEAYGFRPSEEWLQALRLASLRFGQGCSSSFVSPNGLIITNNHCAQDYVGQVQPAEEDWVLNGFFANSLEQEVPVPGLTVQQLRMQEDITAKMNEGLTDEMSAQERQEKLRDNRIAITEAAKEAHPELTHEIVTLYHGGMYQLYSYNVYSDIRLVCAPAKNIAEFGGDPDNFTYPRFCLDFALCRAYEGDKPADTSAHYLRWNGEGPHEGDVVFVTGHPGSTGRLNTIAQMEYMRDVQYPTALRGIDMQLGRMREAMASSEEAAKELRPRLLMFENARKAYGGYLAGLENPEIMNVKRNAEKELRDAIAADPKLEAKFGDAWTELEKIVEHKREDGGRPREESQEEQEMIKRIGEATFAVYGNDIPPDATFTLRISDGVVKGYDYNGTRAPWFTSLYGLFARHTEFGGKDPFRMPDNWFAKRNELDMTTPFNFVTTNDIIGGNSGSPLVDKEGRFVGLVFDGNIESLGNRFVFTDDVARTVCVHPAIITLALREVYDRPALADELEGK